MVIRPGRYRIYIDNLIVEEDGSARIDFNIPTLRVSVSLPIELPHEEPPVKKRVDNSIAEYDEEDASAASVECLNALVSKFGAQEVASYYDSHEKWYWWLKFWDDDTGVDHISLFDDFNNWRKNVSRGRSRQDV